ncbi:MAG: proline dehydrogenase family protein [Candidatus Limnocylindria bacterium]
MIPLLRRLPYRFVAGTTLDEAVAVVAGLNVQGAMATLDVLGESVTDRDTALRAADEYVATIERIASEELDSNVSLKLTQMGIDAGVEVCLESLWRVLAAGRRHGIFVRIDMESHEYVDRTLDIAQRARAEGFDVGVVIQSYLRRSAADVERLAAQRMRVRVCKGAYAEPPEVAFTDRAEIDRNYLLLAQRLLDVDAYPAIATHDGALIDAVARYAAERGIGPDRYEFQMLYGIRRDLQHRLVARGHRVRIYVPFGTEWYPYFMRRLGERPANVLFVLRSLVGELGGEETLADAQVFTSARRYEFLLRRWSAGERPSTLLGARESNRLAREAQTLHKRLRTTAPGRAEIQRLMADPDRVVRLWAATHTLGWDPVAAREVLTRLRDDRRQGWHDAHMVLTQYDGGLLNLDW